jgi:hypothetical protein
MLDYFLVQNKIPAGATDYHAVVTHSEGVDEKSFIKMLSETLNVNEGEAKRVIAGIGTAARNLLAQGWSFKIEGIGTFGLGITGSFSSPDAPFDPAVNKVSIRFHADKELTAAARHTSLHRLHGVEHGPVIDSVEDKAAAALNSKLTPGHGVQISGKNIKIAGTNPACGVRFIDEAGDDVPVAASDLLENGPTKLVFICPPLNAGVYRLRVTTQYSNSSTLIDPPRSYTFEPPLTVV